MPDNLSLFLNNRWSVRQDLTEQELTELFYLYNDLVAKCIPVAEDLSLPDPDQFYFYATAHEHANADNRYRISLDMFKSDALRRYLTKETTTTAGVINTGMFVRTFPNPYYQISHPVINGNTYRTSLSSFRVISPTFQVSVGNYLIPRSPDEHFDVFFRKVINFNEKCVFPVSIDDVRPFIPYLNQPLFPLRALNTNISSLPSF